MSGQSKRSSLAMAGSGLVPGLGYCRRMRIYLAEMLPLPALLVLSTLYYLSVALFGRAVHGVALGLLSWHTAAGIWSIAGVFLMLRLMDEIKDREIDRALFPSRPLPSGRVLESDIRATLWVAIAAWLVVALWLGQAFLTALVVLFYLLLMFRLFFLPDLLRRSLPLSLATHAPIIPLMLGHAFMVFADEAELSLFDLAGSSILRFVLMLWAMSESWELARKIRARGEETAYVTYSRILGARGATLCVVAAQLVVGLLAFGFWRGLGLPVVYPILVAAALAITLFANLRFLLWPLPGNSRLGRFAAAFAFLVLLAQVAGFGAVCGIF